MVKSLHSPLCHRGFSGNQNLLTGILSQLLNHIVAQKRRDRKKVIFLFKQLRLVSGMPRNAHGEKLVVFKRMLDFKCCNAHHIFRKGEDLLLLGPFCILSNKGEHICQRLVFESSSVFYFPAHGNTQINTAVKGEIPAQNQKLEIRFACFITVFQHP